MELLVERISPSFNLPFLGNCKIISWSQSVNLLPLKILLSSELKVSFKNKPNFGFSLIQSVTTICLFIFIIKIFGYFNLVIKEKPRLGSFLKLSLSSDERRILRGKRLTDCDQEIILQLPRKGKLNDGDILSTNESNFYVEIIAKTENLLEISSNSKIELIKTAYHLGNRHVEVEIEEGILLTKSDYVIKNMLLNFKVDVKNTKKKFFPERGAHSHE